MGLGPGWTTFNAATLGFGFEIVVDVRPVPPGAETLGGGSAWLSKPQEWRKRQRLVTVTVKYGKNEVWTKERLVDVDQADAIVSVVNFINKANKSFQINVGNIKASSTVRIAANVYNSAVKPVNIAVDIAKQKIQPIVSKFKKDK
jgi:hypothetical protein